MNSMADDHRITVATFADRRHKNKPITVLTAYDYMTARFLDECNIDAILVGDSLAMVMLGHVNTLSVTLDEMLHHIRAVRRGVTRALLIGDLPFMSYQVDESQALRSAGRLVQEGGVGAVKLEGGRAMASAVRAIVRAGIPVQGHIGLTPQRINMFGGWKVQGRTAKEAARLLDDALTLEDAGCFSIVIEAVPSQVAALITERLTIPTIGIGAGPSTSGQVLVIHDVLGLCDQLKPRFAKRYGDIGSNIREAANKYKQEVLAREFPSPEHTYTLTPEQWHLFLNTLHVTQKFNGASCVSDETL
jgi:3-methyl-2-oxobutanoate hydroxymethyltransferase